METMDLQQLAGYLRRDVREVGKLASRGKLPGRKVGGEWRFARAEIDHWIETELPRYTEQELTALESAQSGGAGEPLLANLLSEATVAVPLPAGTKASVLRELVALAEQTWQVYDPEVILEAVRQREEMASTAQPGGAAVPHPHRRLPGTLGESVVAFGRTTQGIPFGAPNGGLTDLFFLVLCEDDATHLRVLARLARLFIRPGFLDELRAAGTPGEARAVVLAAERQLLEA